MLKLTIFSTGALVCFNLFTFLLMSCFCLPYFSYFCSTKIKIICGVSVQKHEEEYKPYPTQPVPPPQTVSTSPAQQRLKTEDYKSFDIVRAAQYGVYERVVELVDAGYSVNQPDHENVSILHWAAINNRMEIVRQAVLLFNHLGVTVFTILYSALTKCCAKQFLQFNVLCSYIQKVILNCKNSERVFNA